MKATIHMLCGLPCSGKSTLARKIEKERKAVTFSPDEWMAMVFGPDHSDIIGLKYAQNVASLMYRTYARLIELDIDIIIDDGFGSRASRNHIRQKATELGVNQKLYFLSCSEEILLQRLHKRNAELKYGEIYIPEWKFKKIQEFFEPPNEDEEFVLIQETT